MIGGSHNQKKKKKEEKSKKKKKNYSFAVIKKHRKFFLGHMPIQNLMNVFIYFLIFLSLNSTSDVKEINFNLY